MKTKTVQYRRWRCDNCSGTLATDFTSERQLVEWLNSRWPVESEPLKIEARRETRKVEIGGQPLLVKRYKNRLLLPRRAAVVHNTTLRLQRLGVSVPPSLGYAVGAGASLQLAEWLQDTLPLLSFAGKEGVEDKLGPAIGNLMAQVARMHQAGLVHGDLKWGNVLLSGDATWLVDLDSVARSRPGRTGARDLARFVVDCEEAGTSVEFVHWVQQYYGRQRNWDVARVRGWIAKDYQKIAARHRRRYGNDHRL